MKVVDGYYNTLDVNEFSRSLEINTNIKEEIEHVVWICPDCGEVNVNFKYLPNEYKSTCDKCKKRVNVKWVKRKQERSFLDEKLVGTFEETNV